MSGIAEVGIARAAAPEEIVYKATPGRRISLAGQAERTAQAVEGVRADFQAKLDRLERENTALRREVIDMRARSEEAAATTGAALQAQTTTITALSEELAVTKSSNTSLNEELGKAQSTIIKLNVVIDRTRKLFANGGGGIVGHILRQVAPGFESIVQGIPNPYW